MKTLLILFLFTVVIMIGGCEKREDNYSPKETNMIGKNEKKSKEIIEKDEKTDDLSVNETERDEQLSEEIIERDEETDNHNREILNKNIGSMLGDYTDTMLDILATIKAGKIKSAARVLNQDENKYLIIGEDYSIYEVVTTHGRLQYVKNLVTEEYLISSIL